MRHPKSESRCLLLGTHHFETQQFQYHLIMYIPAFHRKKKPKLMGNRPISIIQMPLLSDLQRKTSVTATIFLQNRPMDPQYGTLFVAIGNGNILVFSHHIHSKGYMDFFFAIHMAGDTVMSMDTDPENRLLFVGTTRGYVKTWLISNFWSVHGLPYRNISFHS